MNKNDDLVNGRWSNKFYVAIDYNFCSFSIYYLLTSAYRSQLAWPTAPAPSFLSEWLTDCNRHGWINQHNIHRKTTEEDNIIFKRHIFNHESGSSFNSLHGSIWDNWIYFLNISSSSFFASFDKNETLFYIPMNNI